MADISKATPGSVTDQEWNDQRDARVARAIAILERVST